MSTELLKRKLDGLKVKITLYGFLYGVGIFLAIFAGAFLMLFAMDQIPESFNVGLQGVLWRLRVMILGVVALMVFIFIRYVARPLRENLNQDELALLVEKEYRELNDSLISTVQFERGNLPEHFNSPQLVQATIEKTARETKSMNFTRSVRRSMALLAFLLAFVCLGANSASAVVFDDAYPLFMKRVWAAITFGPLPVKPQQTFLEVSVRVKERNSSMEREIMPVRAKNNLQIFSIPKGDAVVIKAVIDKRRSTWFPQEASIVRCDERAGDNQREEQLVFHSVPEWNFAEESQTFVKGAEARLKVIASQFGDREKSMPLRYREEKIELERSLAIMSFDLERLDNPRHLGAIQKYADKDTIVAALKSLKNEVGKKRNECRAFVDDISADANTKFPDKVRACVSAFMDLRRDLEIMRNDLEAEDGNADIFQWKKFQELAGVEPIFRGALASLRESFEGRNSQRNQKNELRRTLNVLPLRNSQEESDGILPQNRQVFYSSQIPEVGSGMKFYVSCGDSVKARLTGDLSQQYEIRVIDRPATANMNVYIVRPEYVDANQLSVRLDEGADLTTLIGTRIQVSTRINKSKNEIKKASLVYADSAGNVLNSGPNGNDLKWIGYYVVEEDGEEYYVRKDESPSSIEASKKSSIIEYWLEGEFTVTQSGRYWIALTDNNGYSNIEHKVYEVIALKDKIPTMDISFPRQRSMTLASKSVLPFKLVAKDDNNIREIVVKYKINNRNDVESFPLVPAGGMEISSRENSRVRVLAPPDMNYSASDVLSHSAVVIVGDIYRDGSRLNIPGWQMKDIAVPFDPSEKITDGITPELFNIDGKDFRHLIPGDKITYWVECSDYYNGQEDHTVRSKDFHLKIANDSVVLGHIQDDLNELLKQSGQMKKASDENQSKLEQIKFFLASKGAEDTDETNDMGSTISAMDEKNAKVGEESARQNIRARIESVRVQSNANARQAEKMTAEVRRLCEYVEINRLSDTDEIQKALDFCSEEIEAAGVQYAGDISAKLKKVAVFDEDQNWNLNSVMEIQNNISESMDEVSSKITETIYLYIVIKKARELEETISATREKMKKVQGDTKDAPKQKNTIKQ